LKSKSKVKFFETHAKFLFSSQAAHPLRCFTLPDTKNASDIYNFGMDFNRLFFDGTATQTIIGIEY
jgi:hypothetical protein